MRVFAGLVAASALDREVCMPAFDTCLRGAVAMGFSQIRVAGIQLLHDSVVLATVATGRDNDDEAPDIERDQ